MNIDVKPPHWALVARQSIQLYKARANMGTPKPHTLDTKRRDQALLHASVTRQSEIESALRRVAFEQEKLNFKLEMEAATQHRLKISLSEFDIRFHPTPIHCLPVEVMLEIFLFYVAAARLPYSWDISTAIRRPTNDRPILQTCRRWRIYALDDPRFTPVSLVSVGSESWRPRLGPGVLWPSPARRTKLWTDFQAFVDRRPTSIIPELLFCYHNGPTHATQDPNAAKFFEAFSGMFPRARRLRFDFTMTHDDLSASPPQILTNAEALHSAQLKFDVVDRQAGQEFCRLLLSSMPGLKRLDFLCSVPGILNSRTIGRHLRDVDLNGVTLKDFLTVLQCAPLLESASLLPIQLDTFIPPPLPVVHVCLSRFAIVIVPAAGEIFSHITFPALSQLDISNADSAAWPRDNSISFLRRSRCTLRSLIVRNTVDKRIGELLHDQPAIDTLSLGLAGGSSRQHLSVALVKLLHSPLKRRSPPIIPSLRILKVCIGTAQAAAFERCLRARLSAPTCALEIVQLHIRTPWAVVEKKKYNEMFLFCAKEFSFHGLTINYY